jgi:hypothetical protein
MSCRRIVSAPAVQRGTRKQICLNCGLGRLSRGRRGRKAASAYTTPRQCVRRAFVCNWETFVQRDTSVSVVDVEK